MSDNKCRKAINFDLDTKKLKQYYPNIIRHWRMSGKVKQYEQILL